MASRRTGFKETIVAMMDEYMDKAFAETDATMQQKYRETIKQMQKLLLMVTELE